MKVLVLNSGSSSLKFQFLDVVNNDVILSGVCERIGINDGNESEISVKVPDKKLKIKEKFKMPTHKEAIEEVLGKLQEKEIGVIDSIDEIGAIGHRVVHGGEFFKESVIIDEEVLLKMKTVNALAPLHNPANIMGIEICQELIPDKKNVAVFDTAFHQTMPEKAFMYPLPYEDYTDLRVRKYGFHGTSHKYVSQVCIDLLGNPPESKIVVCHLGNGSSITAVKDGKSIDTSMGLTPLQGLMMGSRCGDIDPSAVLYIMKKRRLSSNEMDTRMNKESGILGIFKKTSDMRDVEDAYMAGDERATLAVEMLSYKVKAYIAKYVAELGGADAICFTGGIGEKSDIVRGLALKNMEFMGIKIDEEKNKNFRSLVDENGILDLSAEGSKTKVYIIATNEEYMIAKDTYELTK